MVIDRLVIKEGIRSRLYDSFEMALKLSGGKIVVEVPLGEEIVLSERFACPYCDFSLAELEPRIFSFNAPYGACPECKGLGVKYKLDIDLIIPDKNLSINEGGIKVINLEEDSSTIRAELNALSKKYDIDLDLPIKN